MSVCVFPKRNLYRIFTVILNWKQLKGPSTGEQISRMCFHMMDSCHSIDELHKHYAI